MRLVRSDRSGNPAQVGRISQLALERRGPIIPNGILAISIPGFPTLPRLFLLCASPDIRSLLSIIRWRSSLSASPTRKERRKTGR